MPSERTFRISHAQPARDGLCAVQKTLSNQIVIATNDKKAIIASINFGTPTIEITRLML